ncbi:hypothetical protein C4D60_Mb09t04790 [Musa balbisiana]|uniref:Uncharacterized protein n=1 Tax=Musa balbisiana TaxID=52838 RepID=A0A4S8IFE6_MUSBA|nr:hypothetical protein C4D60_Mb09t04790 [Musa balbisiana]
MWFHLRSGRIRFPDGLHENSIREANCVNLRPSFRVKTIRVTSPNLNRPSKLIKYFFTCLGSPRNGERRRSRVRRWLSPPCASVSELEDNTKDVGGICSNTLYAALHIDAQQLLCSRVAREDAPETMCGIHGIRDSALSMSSKQLSYTSEGMFVHQA